MNVRTLEMSFPLDKLSHFLCWQYEQNHTKQLASSLAPALATIVVSSCISNKYAAAIYFMALSMPGNFQWFFMTLLPPYICEKHKINH